MAAFPPNADKSDAPAMPPKKGEPGEDKPGGGLAAAVCALELAGADPEFLDAADAATEYTVTIKPDGSASVKAGDKSATVPADLISQHMGEESAEMAKLAEAAA